MDPHGSTAQLVGEAGNITKTYEYDSFGNEIKPDKKDSNPFRYCGEYYDRETGEVYLRARYYQPGLGRFLTRDSYTGEEDDPLSLHLYTYCGNDGVNAWDPSGHYSEKQVMKKINNYTQGKKKDKDINGALKWMAKNGKYKKKHLFKFSKTSWNKFDMAIIGFNNFWVAKLKSTKVKINPNYIKAMIKNESTMGTDAGMNGKRDVMQIFNPLDPDVHILARYPKAYAYYIKYGSKYYAEGGGKYKIPMNGYGAVKKLYKKDKTTFVSKRVTPRLSICFGIRWLYYKTQLADGNVRRGVYNYNGGGDPDYLKKIKSTLIKHKKEKLVRNW